MTMSLEFYQTDPNDLTMLVEMFDGTFSDLVIDREDAIRIVEHLRTEFKL